MNDNHIIFVDDDDSEIEPKRLKPRRQRKSTAGVRKIQHIWTEEEIYRLISCVEQHRELWDLASPEYKLRLDGWRSVADNLGVDGVNGTEAKVKWSSLRTTFMINFRKIKEKKSYTVTWKYFKAMMFLEDVKRPISFTSTLKLESDVIHPSIAEEFSVSPPPSASKLKYNKRSQTPSTSQSPTAGSFSSQAIPILDSTLPTLCSSDTNSTFCDNLLAELRTLSESRARTLRYRISRLMMEFIEAN